MSWYSILKEEEIYYHATPFSNLYSIMAEGIKPNFGTIYSTDTKELSVSWICFTNRGVRKIIVVPYRAEPKTHRPATDHSPMMLTILGAPPGAKVYETSKAIEPKQIMVEDILIYDNPCFDKDFARQVAVAEYRFGEQE